MCLYEFRDFHGGDISSRGLLGFVTNVSEVHAASSSPERNFKVLKRLMVFWVVTPYSVVVGYQCFGSPCCFHLQGELADMGENGIPATSHPEDEGSMDLRNVGILPQHFTASQSRRPRL
jgi:hypothetical protein